MNSHDLLEKTFRLLPDQKKALSRMRIHTVSDLLHYFPSRYSDMSDGSGISSAPLDTPLSLYGKISRLETKKSFSSKIPMSTAILTDVAGGQLKLTWMNQAYIAKMYQNGNTVKITGKITDSKYGISMMNPEIEKVTMLPIDGSDTLFASDHKKQFFGYPVYPQSRGISSSWIYHTLKKIFQNGVHKHISDPIPQHLLQKYNLPNIETALMWIHMPTSADHATAARKRFAFQEIFLIQLSRFQERARYETLFSYKLDVPSEKVADFISRFPFTPTDAQTSAISSVVDDFSQDKPMSRLIEGDVGSGKTFIAAIASYITITNRPAGQSFGNLQVAYMAPTEVLATQLFENFIEYFQHTGISIALITGSGCRKFPSKNMQTRSVREAQYTGASNLCDGTRQCPHCAALAKQWTEISKSQLTKWIKNGEIPIVIGTHALIQKSVEFQDLGLVIIDEQHRFGTNQRMKLAKKEGHAPHYLSMTATPIPRTLALTIYGDLDISVVDSMPSGRKPVITEIIQGDTKKRDHVYEQIREQLQSGRQAYVICPRIDEPDPDVEQKLNLKNVTTEAQRLSEQVFPQYRIAIMHSKMTPAKKAQVMKQFSSHEIDILVSTSVVEVGVNVPNATNIIIEGAERFGLAQLHQLRGRVMRSSHQPYCYLFTDTNTEKTTDRLRAFVAAKNGFELAELDLAQRGSGDLAGLKQWGITDLGMEAIRNIKMVEFARSEARDLIAQDPELLQYPTLKSITENQEFEVHME